MPRSADEVVITPGLARSAGLEVGDTWTAVMWNWTGVGENRAVPLTVVGIGDVAGVGIGRVVRARRGATGLGDRPGGADRFLIDSPTPITAEQVAAAAQQGVHVVARDVPIEDPERLSLTLTDGLVVGLGVAFLQIVMLAGAAFAVSLRRRQRELALLSAAGAEPGDLTRAVLASGILLGGIGALLGVRGPVAGPRRRSSAARVAVRLVVGTRAAAGAGHRARAHRGAPRGGCRECRARPGWPPASRWPRPCALATPRTWGWTPQAAGWTGSPSDRRSRGWR